MSSVTEQRGMFNMRCIKSEAFKIRSTEDLYRENKPKRLAAVFVGISPLKASYPFFKLRGQRVLSKNVKLDLLEAEQEG